MKKIFTYLALFMTAMTTLNSCDRISDIEDRHEARTIDGTWTGYIDTYYVDRWGLTGNSYRTTMYFERENAYGGWGYEVDYDINSRYDDYYYCKFTWEVCNGTIRLRYADSDLASKVERIRDAASRNPGALPLFAEIAYDDGTVVEVDFGPTCRTSCSISFLSELAKIVPQSDTMFAPSDKIYLAPPEPKPWER